MFAIPGTCFPRENMNKERDINILRVRYLDGPNIWTYRPVIEAWVDIGLFEELPSNALPGFYERITAWLPGLIEHRCGIGERGGFLKRLQGKEPGPGTSSSTWQSSYRTSRDFRPVSEKRVKPACRA